VSDNIKLGTATATDEGEDDDEVDETNKLK
jgi:hypothetical protein